MIRHCISCNGLLNSTEEPDVLVCSQCGWSHAVYVAAYGDPPDKPQKSKIFCHNCKFCVDREYGSLCDLKREREYNSHHSWWRLYDPGKKNKNNDCPDYQRSWWSKLIRRID